MVSKLLGVLGTGATAAKTAAGGVKNVGGKILDAAGRGALYSQMFNNPNSNMTMGQRITGALSKTLLDETLGQMGTLGQALGAGLGARGSKSSSTTSPTGGGGVPGTTIGGQQIKASNVIQAIDNSTQQILGGLNILNDTFRMGLNATTNQIQAQTSGINRVKRDTEDMVFYLREIYEQLNLLNSKTERNKEPPAEKVGASNATPGSSQTSDLGIIPALIGAIGPMLLSSIGGLLAGMGPMIAGVLGLGALGAIGAYIMGSKPASEAQKAQEKAGANIPTNMNKDVTITNPRAAGAAGIKKPPETAKGEEPDAKPVNRKGIFNKGLGGQYEGQTVEILSETEDGKAYNIRLPSGEITQAGKRTLSVLDEQGSLQNKPPATESGNFIDEEISDLEKKSALINDFATRMGIDASAGVKSELTGGVPTSINGIPVPAELYTEEQKASIATARQMKAMMSGQGGSQGVQQVAAAGATMGAGEYLVNRQRELDAQKETTSEGALRTQEQQLEEKVFEDLIPDLINFEAREVYYKADKITFDAGKIEFNEGTSGTGGEGGMAPAVPGAGADNFDRPGGTEARDGGGSDATKVPTKALTPDQEKFFADLEKGGIDAGSSRADFLKDKTPEQLTQMGIQKTTAKDGTVQYSKAEVTDQQAIDSLKQKAATGGKAGLNENTKLVESKHTKLRDSMGIDTRQYNAFREAMVSIESRGGEYGIMGGSAERVKGGRFAGAYQIGGQEIIEISKSLGIEPPVKYVNGVAVGNEEFLSNPDLQEKIFDAYTERNHQTLMKNPKYAAMTPEEQLKVLGYAHNQGARGASNWLNTGRVGSDAHGTAGTKYYNKIGKQLEATEGQVDMTPEELENYKPTPEQITAEKAAIENKQEQARVNIAGTTQTAGNQTATSTATAASAGTNQTATGPVNLTEAAATSDAAKASAFGPGMIGGKKVISDQEQRERKSYRDAGVYFEGFEGLENVSFKGGSGSRKSPSTPGGTYTLERQNTGRVITDLYKRKNIPLTGAFSTVWNIGTPGSPTVGGHDPKVNRQRTQMQIHATTISNRDGNGIHELYTSGCLGLSPEDYEQLQAAMTQAEKAAGGKLALRVETDKDGNAVYTIIPRSMADDAIEPKEAIKNVAETGNLSGNKTKEPEIPAVTESAAQTMPDAPGVQKMTGVGDANDKKSKKQPNATRSVDGKPKKSSKAKAGNAAAKKVSPPMSTADASKAYSSMNNPTQRPYDVNNQGQGQMQVNVPLGASADFGNKMAANKPMSTSDVIKSSMAMNNPTQRPYDVNNQGQGQMQVNVPLGASADFGNKMASTPPPAATPIAATPARMDPTSAQSAQAVADLSRKTTMNREAASSQGPVQQNINNINTPKTPMQGEGPVDKNSPNPAITDHMDKYLAYMFGGTGATA